MSAVCLRFCLRLLAILCLCISQALCNQDSSSVIRKNTGKDVTIQCRSSEAGLENISLKKGIHKDTDIFYMSKSAERKTISPHFKDRMQSNGNFPNLDILLENLRSNDTGVYWCLYKKMDKDHTLVPIEGAGSVLLVVTDATVEEDKPTAHPTPQDCDQPNKELVVTAVVISSALLLTIIVALFLLFIRKVKSGLSADKPRPVHFNDVYEDMRGTIRR